MSRSTRRCSGRHIREVGSFATLLAILVCGCSTTNYPLTVDVPPRAAPGGIDRVTVADFAPGGWGPAFSQGVRAGLAQHGFVEPVLGGAPVVLEGQVTADRVRTTNGRFAEKKEEKVNGRKVVRQVYKFTVQKQATVTVSYTLREGGRVLAGNTYSRSFDQTYQGNTVQAARAKAPTDDDIVGSMLSGMVDEVVLDVSPHRVTRNVPLQKGEHPGLERGITYMKNGRFEQAFDMWNQVVTQRTNPQDVAAAYYNMGVVREARGELRDAFDMFSRADEILPATDLYLKAMSRVEARQGEVDALGLPSVAAPHAR